MAFTDADHLQVGGEPTRVHCIAYLVCTFIVLSLHNAYCSDVETHHHVFTKLRCEQDKEIDFMADLTVQAIAHNAKL